MLYFVSTPIGNLKDITLRAIEILKSVDEIACEDTNKSRILLNNIGVNNKKIFSYHKFNEQKCSQYIIDKLKNGINIALITDAGTPCISDPGYILIKNLIKNNIEYAVIPGACSIITSLLLSGFDTSMFMFVGFLPNIKSKRFELLTQIYQIHKTIIIYTTVNKLNKDLLSIYEVFGNVDVSIVNEMTKLHEKVIHIQLCDNINIDDLHLKGECVLVIDNNIDNKTTTIYDDKQINEEYNNYIKRGFSKKESIKYIAKNKHINKKILYKKFIIDN